jgi:hypothetical protein
LSRRRLRKRMGVVRRRIVVGAHLFHRFIHAYQITESNLGGTAQPLWVLRVTYRRVAVASMLEV